MAQFLLFNDIKTTLSSFRAGDILDDRQLDLSQLTTAGAVLAPYVVAMETLRSRFVSMRSVESRTEESVLYDSLHIAGLVGPSGGSPGGVDRSPQINNGGVFAGMINTFIIESVSDFPAAVGGVITLPPGDYLINGTVIMGTDNLFLQNGAFLRGSIFTDILLWIGAGVGAHITFDGSVPTSVHAIRQLNLVGAAGEDMFAVSGGSPESIFINNCGIVNASGGALSVTGTFFVQGTQVDSCLNGFRFSGTADRIVMRLCDFSQAPAATSSLVDLGTSIWNLVSIHDVQFSPAAAGFAIDALGNANLTAVTGAGEVTGCRFNGAGGDITGGITVDDSQWVFVSNVNLVNSIGIAQSRLTANAATTVAEDVFNPVLGTFSSGFARRFTVSAAGVITYNGRTPRVVQYDARFIAEMDSAGNNSCSFQLFHTPISTGTPVAVGSPVTLDVGPANDPTALSVLEPVELLPGDTLQLRVSVIGSAVGCTVTELSSLVTAIPTGL